MTKKIVEICRSKLEQITNNPNSVKLMLEEWEKLSKSDKYGIAILGLYMTKIPSLGQRLTQSEYLQELEIINGLITPTKLFIDNRLGLLNYNASPKVPELSEENRGISGTTLWTKENALPKAPESSVEEPESRNDIMNRFPDFTA